MRILVLLTALFTPAVLSASYEYLGECSMFTRLYREGNRYPAEFKKIITAYLGDVRERELYHWLLVTAGANPETFEIWFCSFLNEGFSPDDAIYAAYIVSDKYKKKPDYDLEELRAGVKFFFETGMVAETDETSPLVNTKVRALEALLPILQDGMSIEQLKSYFAYFESNGLDIEKQQHRIKDCSKVSLEHTKKWMEYFQYTFIPNKTFKDAILTFGCGRIYRNNDVETYCSVLDETKKILGSEVTTENNTRFYAKNFFDSNTGKELDDKKKSALAEWMMYLRDEVKVTETQKETLDKAKEIVDIAMMTVTEFKEKYEDHLKTLPRYERWDEIKIRASSG